MHGNYIPDVYKRQFSGCKNIEEIIFPDGLASIGTKAFKGCAKLRQVELSAGVQFQKDSFPEMCIRDRVSIIC